MTPQILLKALQHGYLDIGMLPLIIADEFDCLNSSPTSVIFHRYHKGTPDSKIFGFAYLPNIFTLPDRLAVELDLEILDYRTKNGILDNGIVF